MLVLLALFGCKPAVSDVDVEVDDPTELPVEFLDARQAWLQELAVPIEACVDVQDTEHPAFHGCWDWHSHVHATWSLLALTRMTGDPSYAEHAEQTLDPDAMALELAAVEGGGIDPGEIPYGYAWFLALARERERAGETDLQPMADVIADELEAHVLAMNDTQVHFAHISDAYANLSWELLNLWLWADWNGDSERAAWVEDLVRDDLLPREETCLLETVPDRTEDFFPPCLHRARLILTVLPEEEGLAWLDSALPADFEVHPVPVTSAHSSGLNFSRTWGLYALWQATGDGRIRDMYVEHLQTHIEQPEFWADNYQSYSHWVAQFGVYGLALSYGEDP